MPLHSKMKANASKYLKLLCCWNFRMWGTNFKTFFCSGANHAIFSELCILYRILEVGFRPMKLCVVYLFRMWRNIMLYSVIKHSLRPMRMRVTSYLFYNQVCLCDCVFLICYTVPWAEHCRCFQDIQGFVDKLPPHVNDLPVLLIRRRGAGKRVELVKILITWQHVLISVIFRKK